MNIDADFFCCQCESPSWWDNTAADERTVGKTADNQLTSATDGRSGTDPEAGVRACDRFTFTNEPNRCVSTVYSQARPPTQPCQDAGIHHQGTSSPGKLGDRFGIRQLRNLVSRRSK